MAYEKNRQQKIDEAIAKKEIRQTRTEKSINISWSINCALAFMPEELKGTEEGYEFVKIWYQRFMDIYREWMIENMPEETKYVPISPEESEYLNDKAEEVRQEKIDKYDNIPIIEEQ